MKSINEINIKLVRLNAELLKLQKEINPDLPFKEATDKLIKISNLIGSITTLLWVINE